MVFVSTYEHKISNQILILQEFGRLYKEEKSTHNLKKSKKWYDSKIWENVGQMLYDQFQEFTKEQVSL